MLHVHPQSLRPGSFVRYFRIQRLSQSKSLERGRRSMSSGSSTMQYSPPIIVPATGEHKATMIMLHGLGDTGAGWEEIGSMFKSKLPHVKFIFPTAPTRPITINMGMRMPGWYDITSLSSIDQQEDRTGIEESSRYVQSLVEEEEKIGIPSDKVVVGGFSQGGAVALSSLRWNKKIAAVVALSAYLPMRELNPFVSEANQSTPVFMAHGDWDDVVQYKYGKESFQLLQNAGINVEFQTIPRMGHSANGEELNMVQAFVEKYLPPQ
eukprot:TRINITY_DN1707_c0_g2_i1.p2 TRINITY_DN1707_c0_g2~~TRINITY_DN1707_c0_g2_i1.p2  ORF type:complete len:265 (-),score=24.92 TRINITY_DN1707_c0_g2_i1:268-1062(-)